MSARCAYCQERLYSLAFDLAHKRFCPYVSGRSAPTPYRQWRQISTYRTTTIRSRPKKVDTTKEQAVISLLQNLETVTMRNFAALLASHK